MMESISTTSCKMKYDQEIKVAGKGEEKEEDQKTAKIK